MMHYQAHEHLISSRGLLVTPFVCLLLGASTVRASDVEEILANLRSRRTATRSFYYRLAGSTTLAKGAIMRSVPKEDYTYDIARHLKVDLTKACLIAKKHYEIYNASKHQFRKAYDGFFYNGAELRTFGPYLDTEQRKADGLGESNPQLTLSVPKKTDKIHWYDVAEIPLYQAHGILLPPDHSVSLLDISSMSVNTDLVEVDRDVVNGLECIVLRAPTQSGLFVQYWFAEKLNWSVVRFEWWRRDGPKLGRCEVKQQERNPGFAPHSIEVVNYRKNGDFKSETKLTVTESAMNGGITEEELQGDMLRPGDVVKDRDKRQYFKVDNDIQLKPFDPKSAGPAKGTPTWLILSAILMGLFVFAYAFVRYRRRRRVKHAEQCVE